MNNRPSLVPSSHRTGDPGAPRAMGLGTRLQPAGRLRKHVDLGTKCRRQALAMVTGSTSGIGLGIARTLAGKGYDIVINGFGTPQEIDTAMTQCLTARQGTRVEYHGADLSDHSQIADMFSFTKERFGQGPDVLVNNCGTQYVAPIEDFPKEKWDKILAVNLSASFHTIKLAIPGMKERAWGRIINISSTHGRVASPNKTAYVASKHGLIGLTKVVALETAGTGVTCNAIAPGWVLTPMSVPQVAAIAKEKGISFEEAKGVMVGEKQPSREFVMPDEVGAMVAYLCSNEARQVTGATLSIDGGWTIK